MVHMTRWLTLCHYTQLKTTLMTKRQIVVFHFYIIVVVFPFMKPVLQLVTRLLLRSSIMERAKAAAFIAKTAEDVIHLRRESGVSQVCL